MSRIRGLVLAPLLAVSSFMACALAPSVVTPHSQNIHFQVHHASPVSHVGAAFKVATYNALFASHTDGRTPRRAQFPNSTMRTRRAVAMFRRSGIDVAGLQELEDPARRTFRSLAPEYDLFEANNRAVVWREDEFRLVAGHTIRTRTYHGRTAMTPVVELRQRQSGLPLVVMSVHNPSDARGPAQAFRDEATQQELAEVLRHRHTADPVPVVVLGDMNARARFFCAFTASGDMHAAAGGSHVDGVCRSPSFIKGIDWIMGSPDVAFSRFRDDYVTRRATDHPLITAVARMYPDDHVAVPMDRRGLGN